LGESNRFDESLQLLNLMPTVINRPA
jgi:hypothetical protein